MTRREEIEKVAMEYASPMTEEDEMLKYEAFKSGARWADTYPIHYDGQGMLHVLHKGVEQGKKEMFVNTCKWLEDNVRKYIQPYALIDTDELLKDLRKSMEE